MAPFIIAFYGIACIAAAIAALIIAPRRGRNGQAWAFWCFLVPPLAILLYYLKPIEHGHVVSIVSRPSKDDLLDLL